MAHGDTGTIEPVLVQQVEGRLAIDVQVVLTFTNDDERAEGATVTVVAVHQDGTTTEAMTLTPASAPGAYVGVLDVPMAGDWTVRIEATTPTASLEVPAVQVFDAATTTSTTIEATTSTTAAATTPVEESNDDGIDAAPLAAIGVLVAVGAGAGYWLSRRRSR